MTAPRRHLAQLNVARMKYALDDPCMADFVSALEPVNAQADGAPGFVWRLQSEDGDAAAIRIGGERDLLVNLSVWQSLDELLAFVHSAGHAAVMKRRRAWFERLTEAHVVLWWIAPGDLPDVDEAAARLARLRRYGPTPEAFSFRRPFPPPRPGA